jgi:hypothetical protein
MPERIRFRLTLPQEPVQVFELSRRGRCAALSIVDADQARFVGEYHRLYPVSQLEQCARVLATPGNLADLPSAEPCTGELQLVRRRPARREEISREKDIRRIWLAAVPNS